MKKNQKFLKNLLTTASAFSVLAIGASEAVAAPAARTVTGAYQLNDGTGLNLGVGNAFTNGSVLEISAIEDGSTNGANIVIGAVDTHGQNIAAKALTITAGDTLTLGAVVDRTAAGTALQTAAQAKTANSLLNVTFTGADTLTLTGTTAAFGLFPTNGVDGASIPLADNYSALGAIDFAGKAATIVINATSGNEIVLENATVANTNGNSQLTITKSATVKDASFATIKTFKIANNEVLEFAVNTDLDFDHNGGGNDTTITFDGAGSVLSFDIDTSGGARTILLNTKFSSGAAGGDKGIISVTANGGNGLTIDKGANVAQFGYDNANRISILHIGGDDDITFGANMDVFAEHMAFSTTAGTTTFTKDIDSGANSTLTFTNAGGTVNFNGNTTIANSNFNGQAATIQLNGNSTTAIDNNSIAGQIAAVIAADSAANANALRTAANAQLAVAAAAAGLTTDPAMSQVTAFIAADGGVGNANDLLTRVDAAFPGMGFNPYIAIIQAAGANQVRNVNAIYNAEAGTIEYTGNSTQTGAIGATNAVNEVKIINGTTTIFTNDIKAINLSLGDVAATAKFNNTNVFGNIRQTAGAGNKGIIIFNAANTTVTGSVGDNTNKIATVNILNGKAATIKGIFSADAVNIGEAGGGGGPGTLTLVANNQLIDNVYSFNNAGSSLVLQGAATAAGSTFKLTDNIASTTTKAVLTLDATNGNVTIDTNTGVNGTKTLGIAGATAFANTNIVGAAGKSVTVTANVDLTNTGALNVFQGGVLIDQSGTSLAAPITLGTAAGAGTIGTLIIAGTGDQYINKGAGTITYATNGSILELQSSTVNAGRTFTLSANVNPSANAGILNLNTLNNANNKLTIAGANQLGNTNAFAAINIIGAGTSVVNNDVTLFKTVALNIQRGATFVDLSGKTTVAATGATQINIGEVGGAGTDRAGTYVVGGDVDVSLNDAATDQIKFQNIGSKLILQSTGTNTKTFTLQRNIDSGSNQGVVTLFTAGGANSKITLTGNAGVMALGGNGGKLQSLNIVTNGGGLATIQGAGGGGVDLTNIATLNIGKGAQLVSETNTVGAIAAINIGTDTGAGTGAGTLVIDAKNANVNLNSSVTFADAGSILTLQNTDAGNALKTFTLAKSVTTAGDNSGIVVVNSGVAGGTTITSANKTIGTDATHRIQELRFTGANPSTVDVGVFAKTISVTAGNAKFTKDVETGAGGLIAIAAGKTAEFNGNINLGGISNNTITFGNNAATLLLNGNNITVNAVSLASAVPNTVAGVLQAKGGTIAINSSVGTPTEGLTAFNITDAVATNVTVTGATLVATNVALDANAAHSLTLGEGLQVTTNAITLNHAGSILNIGDGVDITGNIEGTGGAGTGIVNFQNTDAAVNIDGDMGAANKLATVNVTGNNSTVTVTGNMNTTNLNFTAVDAATLEVEGDLTTAGNITTVGNFIHTLAVGGDFNAGAGVGADGNAINIVLTGDTTVTIGGANNFFATVATETAGQGKVNFNAANAHSYTLGGAGLSLNSVTFTQDGKVIGSAFADTFTINAGRTATFEGNLNQAKDLGTYAGSASGKNMTVNTEVIGGQMTFADNASTAIFGDGSVINVALVPNALGNGKAQFLGNAAIFKDMGTSTKRLTNVEFADNSTVYLGGNIYTLRDNVPTTSIEVDNTNLVLINDVNVDGHMVGNNVTINVANSTFDYVGQSKLGGTVNFAFSNVNTAAGKFYIHGAGSKLDLSTATAVNVTLNSTGSNASVIGQTITLVTKDNSAQITAPTVAASFTPNDPNTNIGWNYDAASYSVTAFDRSSQAVTERFGNNSEETTLFNQLFADVEKDSDIYAYKIALGTLTNDQFSEAQERLANVVTATPQALAQMVSGVTASTVAAVQSGISARMSHLSAQAIQVSETTGVAAGDEVASYGLWATPFFGQTIQGARGSNPGYKANSFGTTLGFDTMANDDLLVGAAYTYANTKLDHKHVKLGDKTEAKTNMFSVYAVQQLPKNFFGQVVASFGSSRINNKEARIYPVAKQIATANYDSTAYSIEATGGYNLVANKNTVITPMLGARFSRYADSGYRETGTTLTNYSVGKKANNKLDAILGARVTFNGTFDNGLGMSPEVHAFVNQALISKEPKVDAIIDGQSTSRVNQPKKQAKTFVNVGTSLTTRYSMMEYGLGYDAYLSNKYVSHQGTIKVRVNF
jgi:hypothetical protein